MKWQNYSFLGSSREFQCWLSCRMLVQKLVKLFVSLHEHQISTSNDVEQENYVDWFNVKVILSLHYWISTLVFKLCVGTETVQVFCVFIWTPDLHKWRCWVREWHRVIQCRSCIFLALLRECQCWYSGVGTETFQVVCVLVWKQSFTSDSVEQKNNVQWWNLKITLSLDHWENFNVGPQVLC